LGDLGGARTRLAKRGLTFNGHVTSEFAGNVTGGIPLGGTAVDRGTALSTEVGIGFDADLGMLTNTGVGVVHALVTTRFGSNLSSTALGNLISVQEIYGDGQTTRFTYLDYEQPLFKKKLSVLLGKINQQNDFIAGPTYWGGNLYCFYQNNNICGTPAAIPTNNGVTSAGSAGYNYYPSSMWGVRLKASPSKILYVEAAALQANPIVNTSHGGTYFGFAGATGTELPVEVGLTLRNPAGDSIGDIRVGGYYDTSNVLSYAYRGGPLFLPASPSLPAVQITLPSQYMRGRSGAYVQLDHLVAGRSAAGQPGTAVFVAAEYSDPNTALLTSFVDAGVVRSGTFHSRPNDTIALGFATDNYNPRLQHVQLALQTAGYAVPYNGSEKAFELNYSWHASNWLVIRPGLQYVLNPNGSETNTPAAIVVPKNALVIGLGTDISF
jgi:porin